MDYEEYEEEYEIDSEVPSDEFSEEYKEEVISLLNKVVSAEISSASAYLCMAEMTENGTLAAELSAHAMEEFGHYKKIIGFLYAHGLEFDVSFQMDLSVSNDFPTDNADIVGYVQMLEREAIEDYRTIAILARDNDDLETEAFFTALMKEEQEHFDDLARYNGERRVLKSFKAYAGY